MTCRNGVRRSAGALVSAFALVALAAPGCNGASQGPGEDTATVGPGGGHGGATTHSDGGGSGDGGTGGAARRGAAPGGAPPPPRPAGGVGARGGGGAGAGGAGGASTTSTTSGAGGSIPTDCKTECLGVECGPVPDGCGGVLACGDCGDGTDVCIKEAPEFQGDVKSGVDAVKAEHPEYFDFDDSVGGESVKVLDPAGFRDGVVVWVNASSSLVCIPDANDSREIRVKDQVVDAAENYLLITSGGYSVYKYTSTCYPAGF